MSPSPALPALDRVLFRGPLATIGAFRAPVDDPRFGDSGPIERHVFVFPRTCVWIRHEGGEGFVADPTVVTYYNRGQTYRRAAIGEDGDRCEWFAVEPDALTDTLGQIDPRVDERPERPFAVSHAPSDAATYLRQRRLVRALAGPRPLDPLAVEETVLALLEAVVAALPREHKWPRVAPGVERRHRELVEDARRLLAARFREAVGLSDLALLLGVTPGHLCRVFRAHTGTTLHRHREELRLRSALDGLGPGRGDLTDLALSLGYSSHSHFTERFRRHYGFAPSAYRAGMDSTVLRLRGSSGTPRRHAR